MALNFKQLRDRLRPFGQEHLLRFWGSLGSESQAKLSQQIEDLDLDLCQRLFDSTKSTAQAEEITLSPLPSRRYESQSESEKEQWRKLGTQSIQKGELAVLLVAGGQGSRLGFDGPKGCFRPKLPSGKSLFQVQAERLLGLCRRTGVNIPWYIMTSPLNDADTRRFFKERNYFGYPKSHIFFFPQGMLPAMDTSGKILLESPDQISLVPDGNGGCFKAMRESGAWDDMRARGCKQLFVYGVDNLMTRIGDAMFLGFHLDSASPCSTKVVSKTSPEEKLGVVAQMNGKPGIVEYSDLDDAQRYERDAQGNLSYGAGSIAIHLFDVEKLEEVLQQEMPYHRAFKKVGYVDEQGDQILPSTENAWKFEQFLFDVFPLLGRLEAFEILREEEFAPVKNADGVDSPATARELMVNFHTKQLREMGLPLKDGLRYEVSGLAYPDFLRREWQACLDLSLVFPVEE